MSLLLLLKKRNQPSLRGLITGFDPSAISFSRASVGTRFNSAKLLVSEAIDAPRFTYNPLTGRYLGLLYEPQKINTALYGTDPANAAITRFAGALTPTGAVAPDGSGPMARFSGILQVRIPCGSGISAGAQITISVYARLISGSVSSFTADHRDGAGVNLAPQLVLGETVRLSGITTAGSSGQWLDFSITTGATCDIWGYQVEAGSVATSYIPTEGIVATRAEDQLSFTIPSGVSALRYTFDDDTTQDVSVSAGSYTVPTNLNRSTIKRIQNV